MSRSRKLADVLKPLWLSLSACALLLGAGCGKSRTELDHLAQAGSIHEEAPVTAHLQILIDAPPARVWALLVDAAAWPRWQTDIQSVSAPGPLAKGMPFSWRSGGTEIQARVQLHEPGQRLGWTGAVFTAKAIHLWELQPAPDERTLVVLRESMDGPLIATLYPATELTASDQRWLAALKRAAEQGH